MKLIIAHQLGRAAAIKRLDEGLHALEREFAHRIDAGEKVWVGDEVFVKVVALGATSTASATVYDEQIDVMITLPFALKLMAMPVRSYLEREAQAYFIGP